MPALQCAKRDITCSYCGKAIERGGNYIAVLPPAVDARTIIFRRHPHCHLATQSESWVNVDNSPLSSTQAGIVLHALGISDAQKSRPYRNYYFAPAAGAILDELSHLTKRGVLRLGVDRVYHVTQAGGFMVGQTIPEEN